MTAYRNGLLAEIWVALVLQLKGYRILSRRLRTPGGEIDLLAKRGQTLVLVEVKLRPSLSEAAGAISNRQQNRLQTAARFVLAQRPDLCFKGGKVTELSQFTAKGRMNHVDMQRQQLLKDIRRARATVVRTERELQGGKK